MVVKTLQLWCLNIVGPCFLRHEIFSRRHQGGYGSGVFVLRNPNWQVDAWGVLSSG